MKLNKRRKIILLMLHLQHGGIEKQTAIFVNELAKKYDVEVICIYSMNKKPAYEIDERVRIRYLIDGAPNKKEFLFALKRLRIPSIIKEGVKAQRILRLKKRLMIKEIKELNCDFVVSTRIEYAEMLSKYAPKDVVTITQEHLHDDSYKYIERLKNAIKNLDYLIALGPDSKKNYEKWFSENKKIKIVEISNMIDENFDEVSKLDGYTLISIGRMHPVKGFDDLLKIIKKVKEQIPNIKLNLLGGGEEFEKLKNEVIEMQLEQNVNMTGMIDSDKVNQYMLMSDIYVMTSFTECFPMVLLEASNCGLPLIAFDVPVGPKALILEEFNGYLIQNRDTEEMAKKIVYLLRNRSIMKKMGENSKKNVIQYLPDSIMKKWYSIFDK